MALIGPVDVREADRRFPVSVESQFGHLKFRGKS
jgi:hypothetical protein